MSRHDSARAVTGVDMFPAVIGSDPTDCLTACLLDSDCKGVTWRPSSTNTTFVRRAIKPSLN
eukprot:763143-Hanusia_phi.AAC.3